MDPRGLGQQTLHADRFNNVADFLQAVAPAGGERCGKRSEILASARAVAEGLRPPTWKSPQADLTLGALKGYCDGVESMQRDVLDAYRAMLVLTAVARETAAVIAEVEQYERTNAEALLHAVGGTATRAFGDFLDTVHLKDDDEAQRERDATDAYNRKTDEASQRRGDQLRLWDHAVRTTAEALRKGGAALGGQLAAGIPEHLRRPGGQSEAQLTAALQQQWAALTTARLETPPDSEGQKKIDAWWATLTPEEQATVIATQPAFVTTYLLGTIDPATLTQDPTSGDLYRAIADERLKDPTASNEELVKRAATRLGTTNAEDLKAKLNAAGLDPDSTLDPSLLAGLDPKSPVYKDLLDKFEKDQRFMQNGDYATAYMAKLGPGGIQATLGVLDLGFADLTPRFGEDVAPANDPRRNRQETLLDGFTQGFAITTGRDELKDTRAHLLNFTTEWQRRQLGLLMSAPGDNYDPAFLVAGADKLIFPPAEYMLANPPEDAAGKARYDKDRSYPGLFNNTSIYRDVERMMPDVVAIRSLSQNKVASFAFLHDETGVRQKQLDLVLRPGEAPDYTWYYEKQALLGSETNTTLANARLKYANNVLNSALIDAPLDRVVDPRHATELYSAAITNIGGTRPDQGPPMPLPQLGQSDRPVSAASKLTTAQGFGIYYGQISEYAWKISEGGKGVDLVQFKRPDLVKALKIITADPVAGHAFGTSMMTAVQVEQKRVFDKYIEDHPGAPTERDKVPLSEILGLEVYWKFGIVGGAVYDGVDGNGDAAKQVGEAAGDRAAQVLDIGIDLIPGGSFAKVAGKPLIKPIIGMAKDNFKSAVTANSTPTSATGEQNQALKQSLGDALRDSIATQLDPLGMSAEDPQPTAIITGVLGESAIMKMAYLPLLEGQKSPDDQDWRAPTS